MAQTMLSTSRPVAGYGVAVPQSFSVPARHNPRLQALVDRLNADEELRWLWRCANINAVDRLGQGDSGEVHVRIVANAALKLLRLLREAGEVPGVTEHHRLPPDEAEIVVVLAAALHVLSLAAGNDAAQGGDLSLAGPKGRELLAGLYSPRERTVVLAETLHAIGALPASALCLTLEASVLKLADALDLTKGRVRLPAAALATPRVEPVVLVDEVLILKHKQPPVRVLVGLSGPDGAAQVEAWLQPPLRNTQLAGRVDVLARLGPVPHADLVPLRVWAAS